MEEQVGVWQSIKQLLAGSTLPDPTEAEKLDGASQGSLSQSLAQLKARDRGWITFGEAQRLFSAMEPEYAFGEMDKDGSRNLAAFAAKHQSDVNFMPAEGRVYFLHNRG